MGFDIEKHTIRAGYGIGIHQVALARRDAELVRILPDLFERTLDTCVAMNDDLRSSHRCRVVFHALVAGLKKYAQIQYGTRP